jgi:hypothetical protein
VSGAQAEIRAALVLVRESIPASDVGWIEEFLDHNEPGVALDAVVEALMDGGIQPSEAVYEHLRLAAEGMGVAESELWTRFTQFAAPS